jgi:hypothetical protein
MLRARLLLLTGFLLALGCGQASPEAHDPKAKQPEADRRDEVAGAADKFAAPPEAPPADAARDAKKGAAQAPAAERKIIQTARVDVVVDDFDKAEGDLRRLAKDSGGYLARSEVRGNPGSPRSGNWTARVPAARFDDFLAAVRGFGELRQSTTDSQDITDGYYDLKAHVKNDQTREEALRKLYVERAAGSKLEDLLAVDRELSAVRGKIDEETGRLQRWDKEVAFSTAVVTLQERKGYVPETTPDFAASVGHTFGRSVDLLAGFGRFLVLAAVALGPWLPVLALAVVPAWVFLRRRPRPLPPPTAVRPAPPAV